MEPLLLIGIIAAIAVLLFAIEVFVTPGIGLAGIAATVCVVIADSLVYYYYDGVTATITLIISFLLTMLIIWLSRKRTIEKMALKANIDSTNATKAQLSVSPGETGRALTRLALIGNAEIGGRTVEVKSTGDFIDEGTPIVVTDVQDALILVKKKEG